MHRLPVDWYKQKRKSKSPVAWEPIEIANPFGVKNGKAVAIGDVDLDGRPDIVHTTNSLGLKGKPAVAWLSYRQGVADKAWQVRDISGPIGAKFAIQAVQVARRVYPKMIISAEIGDQWFTTQFNDAYLDSPEFSSRPDVVAPVETWLNRPVTKLLLVGRQDKLTEAGIVLRQELSSELVVAQTEEHLLQIIHKLASKALCLRSVANQLGIDRSEVMAIGDNANDCGMLQWAEIGVAMANASPRAIEAADYITASNDADGVAHAVRRAVLDKRPPGRRLKG